MDDGCTCGRGPDGQRRLSTRCRLHRDVKLNECEDGNCPGCWTCYGEFWNPEREESTDG